MPRPCPARTGVITRAATARARIGARRHSPPGTGVIARAATIGARRHSPARTSVITRAATARAEIGARRHCPPGTGVIARPAGTACGCVVTGTATAATRLAARLWSPATGGGLIVRLPGPA